MESIATTTTTTTGAQCSILLLTRLSSVVYRRASEAALGMSLKEYMALINLRDQASVTQYALGDAVQALRATFTRFSFTAEANVREAPLQ